MHHLNETAGTLTLMGSGEMSPGMAETHRRIMRQIDGDVRPAFIDTPAGFELNVTGISEKAREYFREHFDLDLHIASFPNAAVATPLTMEAALKVLRASNYIFSGPGSPTYAVRNWRGTPIFETMAGKLAAGSQLVLASAATLSVGRYTIPVYEIYKVGEEPHWVDGLDLLGRYGLELAIVPHWNNTSGGNHDTTHCFIGQARFDVLRAHLPTSATVLGIDEYTACMLSPHEQTGAVYGAGTVTVLCDGAVHVFGNGDTFAFDVLRTRHQPTTQSGTTRVGALTDATLTEFRQALRAHQPASAVGYVHSLIELMRQTREAHDSEASLAYLQLTIREMLAALAIFLEEHPLNASKPPAEDPLIAPLMQLLIDTRAELRKNKQYAQADQLRSAIDASGVELQDTPQGAVWKRKS
jgi:hypothetical protein